MIGADEVGDDERGSVLPLILVYMLLGIALTLVCANAVSLFTAQKRTDALADAAALAASDGFEIVADAGGARIRLDPALARRQAEEVLAVSPVDAHLAEITTPDPSTARAVVATTWHPVMLSLFVPDGVALDAVGTSRASLAG
ncbi:MAG: hypothetical protein ACTHY8_01700 [Microbacterium gubbeenense]|uniref:hypothetical protein n=1 Tax=Microbacterium gubbeenense TaxID=159896 RepID=UPI003F94DDC4